MYGIAADQTRIYNNTTARILSDKSWVHVLLDRNVKLGTFGADTLYESLLLNVFPVTGT